MITVRPFQSADIEAVADIEAEGDATWSKESFLDAGRGGDIFLIASLGERTSGFLLAKNLGPDFELLKLSVKPEFRRRGVAGLLLGRMCQIMKQSRIACCHLEVNINNRAAISLYKTSGFELVGRRKAYYESDSGRQDALLMRKTVI